MKFPIKKVIIPSLVETVYFYKSEGFAFEEIEKILSACYEGK